MTDEEIAGRMSLSVGMIGLMRNLRHSLRSYAYYADDAGELTWEFEDDKQVVKLLLARKFNDRKAYVSTRFSMREYTLGIQTGFLPQAVVKMVRQMRQYQQMEMES